MVDVSDLPESFDALRECLPANATLSERQIEPVIVISRESGLIVARLGGFRMVRGVTSLLLAPSNSHQWVLDGLLIRPLPTDSPSEFAAMMQGADASNLSYGDAIRLAKATGKPIVVQLREPVLAAAREATEQYPPALDVPGLNATLFPYQARGIGWMDATLRQASGLILADEMGLGKTLQIIALLLLDLPPVTAPALIICPTSLIANWVRECERFAPSLSVVVHRGPHRAGIFRELQKSNIVVTTYDTMVNDISIFSSLEWSWMICDEAQALKNPDSNRRKSISTIPRRKTVPMTGTPVENSLLDLWSLTDLAIPDMLGTREQFEESYPDSLESAQALAAFTDPVILKRKVSEVAGDLPERIDIDVPLELDDDLAQHYRDVRKATLAKYPVAGALVATLQLQLVCAHPWLRASADPRDPLGEKSEILRVHAYPLVTPKMERAAEIIREAFISGQKVIIFSLFNRIDELLKEVVPANARMFWDAINGSTPQPDRQSIIDRFTAHAGPACLVLNPKAAGAGLNITAATVVIHFTPVWNPAIEAQASARAHRRGQTRPVTVYRLFYKDTVEDVMIDRALWKTDLANESVPTSTRDASDLRRALEVEPAAL